MAETRTLQLSKGTHQFVITYEVGKESEVLDQIVDMVHRRDVPFDWFDAAILSHKLKLDLKKELQQLENKKYL